MTYIHNLVQLRKQHPPAMENVAMLQHYHDHTKSWLLSVVLYCLFMCDWFVLLTYIFTYMFMFVCSVLVAY